MQTSCKIAADCLGLRESNTNDENLTEVKFVDDTKLFWLVKSRRDCEDFQKDHSQFLKVVSHIIDFKTNHWNGWVLTFHSLKSQTTLVVYLLPFFCMFSNCTCRMVEIYFKKKCHVTSLFHERGLCAIKACSDSGRWNVSWPPDKHSLRFALYFLICGTNRAAMTKYRQLFTKQ